MTIRSAEHATLVIERHLKAPISRVFRSWSTPESKRQCFACHGEWVPLDYDIDVMGVIGVKEAVSIGDV
ncbi:ATPase, partial [Rhizobium johnstonii]